MILRGAAGTGKTHLLCDLARQRISAGRPTVLLLGQRFVSNEVPWSQALQQLDLPGLSAEEFVGALEAAAQAAGSRALLIIDAINEGAGRKRGAFAMDRSRALCPFVLRRVGPPPGRTLPCRRRDALGIHGL